MGGRSRTVRWVCILLLLAATVLKTTAVVTVLSVVASTMSNTTKYSFAQQDVPVSVARDLAQAAIVGGGAAAMSATAALTSNAEHDVVGGQPRQAVAGLAKARAQLATAQMEYQELTCQDDGDDKAQLKAIKPLQRRRSPTQKTTPNPWMHHKSQPHS